MDLLLTPQEIDPIADQAGETMQHSGGLQAWQWVEAACKAQLAKAEPLIRKDERERIFEGIQDAFDEVFPPPMPDAHLRNRLTILWDKIQALKDGSEQKRPGD